MSESDETVVGDDAAQAAPGPVQLRIERLYLKDASFESPAAPGIFASQQWRPKNQVDINTTANRLDETRHEVVLTTTVTCQDDAGKTAYVAEVQYAGVFVIEGAAPTQLQQILGVACPHTLFPYVRENLDSLVTRGGFPPLHIAPVNFEALFAQAIAQARQPSSADATTTH